MCRRRVDGVEIVAARKFGVAETNCVFAIKCAVYACFHAYMHVHTDILSNRNIMSKHIQDPCDEFLDGSCDALVAKEEASAEHIADSISQDQSSRRRKNCGHRNCMIYTWPDPINNLSRRILIAERWGVLRHSSRSGAS